MIAFHLQIVDKWSFKLVLIIKECIKFISCVSLSIQVNSLSFAIQFVGKH